MTEAKDFLFLLLLVLAIALLVHAVYIATTCDGTVVRGAFSFQCIEEADDD